jgi:hypothetical protein
MSFASSMIALVASGIGVAICSVGLSIYLMLVKENHFKTRENRIEKRRMNKHINDESNWDGVIGMRSQKTYAILYSLKLNYIFKYYYWVNSDQNIVLLQKLVIIEAIQIKYWQ